jgi:hypothetical protein
MANHILGDRPAAGAGAAAGERVAANADEAVLLQGVLALDVATGQVKPSIQAQAWLRLGKHYEAAADGLNSAAALCYSLAAWLVDQELAEPIALGKTSAPSVNTVSYAAYEALDRLRVGLADADLRAAAERLKERRVLAAKALAKTVSDARKAECVGQDTPDILVNAATVLRLADQNRLSEKSVLATNAKNVDFLLMQLESPTRRPRRSHHGRDRRSVQRWDSASARYRTEARHVPSHRASSGVSPYGYADLANDNAMDLVPVVKTATTVVAPGGKNSTYNLQPESVAFLFDRNYCYLKKEHYVFNKNVVSNDKWWLGPRPGSHAEPPTSFDLIFDSEAARIRDHRSGRHTEQLISPTKASTVGVVALSATPMNRLIAHTVREYMAHYLTHRVPVFTQNARDGLQAYETAAYEDDLHAIKTAPGGVARTMREAFHAGRPYFLLALRPLCDTAELRTEFLSHLVDLCEYCNHQMGSPEYLICFILPQLIAHFPAGFSSVEVVSSASGARTSLMQALIEHLPGCAQYLLAQGEHPSADCLQAVLRYRLPLLPELFAAGLQADLTCLKVVLRQDQAAIRERALAHLQPGLELDAEGLRLVLDHPEVKFSDLLAKGVTVSLDAMRVAFERDDPALFARIVATWPASVVLEDTALMRQLLAARPVFLSTYLDTGGGQFSLNCLRIALASDQSVPVLQSILAARVPTAQLDAGCFVLALAHDHALDLVPALLATGYQVDLDCVRAVLQHNEALEGRLFRFLEVGVLHEAIKSRGHWAEQLLGRGMRADSEALRLAILHKPALVEFMLDQRVRVTDACLLSSLSVAHAPARQALFAALPDDVLVLLTHINNICDEISPALAQRRILNHASMEEKARRPLMDQTMNFLLIFVQRHFVKPDEMEKLWLCLGNMLCHRSFEEWLVEQMKRPSWCLDAEAGHAMLERMAEYQPAAVARIREQLERHYQQQVLVELKALLDGGPRDLMQQYERASYRCSKRDRLAATMLELNRLYRLFKEQADHTVDVVPVRQQVVLVERLLRETISDCLTNGRQGKLSYQLHSAMAHWQRSLSAMPGPAIAEVESIQASVAVVHRQAAEQRVQREREERAVKCLQAVVRGRQAMQRQQAAIEVQRQQLRLREQTAARLIQRVQRRRVADQAVQRMTAARRIQVVVRGHRQQQRTQAASCVQALVRRHAVAGRCAERLQQKRRVSAVTTVQALFRGRQVRKAYCGQQLLQRLQTLLRTVLPKAMLNLAVYQSVLADGKSDVELAQLLTVAQKAEKSVRVHRPEKVDEFSALLVDIKAAQAELESAVRPMPPIAGGCGIRT